MESVWKLLQAVSDDAVPILGSLTADYLKEQLEPDPFFRGFTRVLSELSSSELKNFQNVVNFVLSIQDERLIVDGRRGETRSELEVRKSGKDGLEDGGFHRTQPPKSYQRLCLLLKANYLAEDMPTGDWGGSGGPGVMIVERSTFERIRRYLG